MKRLALIFIFVFIGLNRIVWADNKQDQIPQMRVNGEASVFKPADQMELLVDVMTEGKDVKKAVEENNRMINQTLNNLVKAGLTKEEFQTSKYQVEPIYHIPTQDEKESQQTIDHYLVHHSIAIKTQKLELKNAIIGAAVEGGANQIKSLIFNSISPQAYREEALALAAKNALDNARALAAAANVKIVRLLSLTVEQLQDQSKSQLPRMSMAKFSGANNYEPSIEEGPIEIYAAVNMTLEIASE